jgi:protein-S-isoprenylcysteine O-methyltransferase Ste14
VTVALREEFESNGNWLFKRRSLLPLIPLAVVVLGFPSVDQSNHSENGYRLWEMVCLAVAFFGLVIRIVAIGHAPRGTSGRNTERQIADSLSTDGLYSVVRHPLYLGNFFIYLAMGLFAHTWWLVLICVLAFWLYYERIMYAEEAFLRRKFGSDFDDWASRVPAFVPDLRRWRPFELPFSARNAVRREYHGFFAIIVTMFVLKLTQDYFLRGRLQPDPLWTVMLAIGLVIWLVLRTIKKRTRWLDVENR